MKPPAPSSVLGALLPFACGVIVVACGGGGGGQSLEEYFQELDAVEEDLGAQADAAQQEFPTAFQESVATRDYLVEISSILGQALDALRGTDPPEQAQSAHSEFIDAIATNRDLWEDVAGELGDAPSPAEVAEVSERYGPQLQAASAQLQDACLALEGIAADNDIEVDLSCEEE